jgi:hypothetical protein
MGNVVIRILVFCLAVAVTTSSLAAQASRTVAQQSDPMVERIDEIFSSSLKEGRFTLKNGVTATTRVPPSTDAVHEIRDMGSKAVPILARHLKSPDPREQELAIRFLGAIGGEEVVEPLGTVVLTSSYGTARLLALGFLSQAPWDSIRDYVQHATTDSEPAVRKEAFRIQSARQ